MNSLSKNLSAGLEPIAGWFRNLGIPEAIVHWGHPLMMGIVIFAMGSFVGYTGWQGRLAQDKDMALKNRSSHRQLAPLMFLFLALGYTGGVLSLVMQRQPLLASPHFWTGTIALGLLSSNSLLSLTGFWGDKSSFRIAHAYLGTVTLGLLIVHTALGIKLGLSL
jgi:F0F1-type ATP synthase membrane subunit c/vacuolar-type H+-ATPase subunit K